MFVVESYNDCVIRICSTEDLRIVNDVHITEGIQGIIPMNNGFILQYLDHLQTVNILLNNEFTNFENHCNQFHNYELSPDQKWIMASFDAYEGSEEDPYTCADLVKISMKTKKISAILLKLNNDRLHVSSKGIFSSCGKFYCFTVIKEIDVYEDGRLIDYREEFDIVIFNLVRKKIVKKIRTDHHVSLFNAESPFFSF